MALVPIAAADELGVNEMKAVELDGKRLLLVRAAGGHFLIDEMCTREDYSLALGCIKGRRIKCSLHGSYFDLATGEPDEEPADEPICSYFLEEKAGQIWADIERPRPGASGCRRG